VTARLIRLADRLLGQRVTASIDRRVRAQVAAESPDPEEWWAQDLVLPGGIVVVDDFGDGRWPGVERAARRYHSSSGRLELVGTVATSDARIALHTLSLALEPAS
jgi:hypothetical protein